VPNLKLKLPAGILAAVVFAGPLSPAVVCRTGSVRAATTGPGVVRSPGGKGSVILAAASNGGFEVLSYGEPPRQVEDVSAVVWISDSKLAYSVSPIYGKPGIYVLDCADNRIRQIVGPKTRDRGYPDGADYFELKDLVGGRTLRFYYAPDVDRMDAVHLRAQKHLFSVGIDGSQFRKAR